MPKFDVHIYPIFRTKVRLEAESPDHAERMATGMIFDNFARLGHGFSVGRHEFEFADDTDIALVDLLDDAGGVQESVPVGDKSCLNSSELATVLAALRHWQQTVVGRPEAVAYPHFEEIPPLSAAAIDRLCERLNCRACP